MKSSLQADVIIVGAGVLGVSLAYHLSQRKLRVIVFEREKLPACHASGKNAGMIRQLYRNEQLTEWTNLSIATWPAAIRDRYFQQTGSYVVGREVPAHHQELFEQQQLLLQQADGKQQAHAVFCKTDGLLDSPGYVNALYQLAKSAGVGFHFGINVESVEKVGDDWRVSVTGKIPATAPWVVNAGGAWAAVCAGDYSKLMRPFARYLFVVDGFPENFMPEKDCGFYWNELDGWYMRQWDKASRLVSICDTIPATPETFVPTFDSRERLSATLLRAFPHFASSLCISHHWHCFRTYTDDQLPIWGEDGTQKGYFWLAAFGGFGMSTSFAASEDAARYIAGERITMSENLLPTRFSVAHPSKIDYSLGQPVGQERNG